MEVFDLKTEFKTDPIGIDTATPFFTWKLRNCKRQEEYRIVAASSRENLEIGRADLWDSGIIADCGGYSAVYGGKELESRRTYWWKVQVNGVWSPVAKFETAFMHPETEFRSKWIGMPLGFGGATDCYRLDIPIAKPISKARLYIAVLGTGRVYLNGKLLDDSYFDGALSVYEKTIFYRTLELPLQQGNNALCIEVGYGFYGAKKIYGQVYIEYADGTYQEYPTIAGRVWNVKKDAVVQQSLYDGEIYDARREENWKDIDYKVSWGNWVAAFAADPLAGRLKANPIPPMRVAERLCPKAIERRKDGRIFVDAGENICGFLKISVKGSRGASVRLRYSERLLPNGELDRANLRAAECTDVYILRGGDAETYAPQFTYHGFQYAELTLEGDAELLEVEVLHIRSDLSAVGKFVCSDEVLNHLHKLAFRTESNNLNGVFTDCPQRDERLGWLNDLSSRIFESLCNFDLSSYLPNFVNMITDAQNELGEIPDTVPFSVGCEFADPISAYILLGLLAYNRYGDKRVLKENYRGFMGWMNRLKQMTENGVVQYSLYGDWCPAKIYAMPGAGMDTFSKYVPKEFMSAVYFIWYLKMMAEIAEILGYERDAAAFVEEYAEYKKAFDKKYYNAEAGVYGGGSQTECAVAMTVFPEDEHCAKWAMTAEEDIVRRGYHMTCGNQGYRHLFSRLAEAGYADTLVKLLKNPEYPGWGYMLEKGATSIWERWEDTVGTDMHSFDHPMFAAYDNFFYSYLAGIRMEECRNAFGEIVIEPCFVEGLRFVEAEYESVRGSIGVRWERTEEGYCLALRLPYNTTTTLRAFGKRLCSSFGEFENSMKLDGGEYKIMIKENKHEGI